MVLNCSASLDTQFNQRAVRFLFGFDAFLWLFNNVILVPSHDLSSVERLLSPCQHITETIFWLGKVVTTRHRRILTRQEDPLVFASTQTTCGVPYSVHGTNRFPNEADHGVNQRSDQEDSRHAGQSFRE